MRKLGSSFMLRKAVLVLGILVACRGQNQASTQNFQSFSHVADALAEVASALKVSVGFEAGANDSDNGPVKLDIADKNVVGILNDIVQQCPAYEWSFEDGVYDVYPKDQRSSLSNVTVRQFAIRNVTPNDASQTLSSLPEVRNWLSEHGLTRQEFYTGPRWKSHERISLELDNVQIRRILNNLMAKVGNTQWTIVRYGDKKEYIGIYF